VVITYGVYHFSPWPLGVAIPLRILDTFPLCIVNLVTPSRMWRG
jgi:hypothetical protein